MIPYTPIDLAIELPDTAALYHYCLTNTLSKNPNLDNGIICMVGCKEDLTDWRATIDCYDGRIYDQDTENFYNAHYDRLHKAANSTKKSNQVFFEPEFKKQFPSLVDACLKLPFEFLSSVHLLLAGNRGTPLHRDPPPLKDDPSQQSAVVPNRYNISLNCFDDPRFFVIKEDGTEKTYMRVTSEYPCFAFNNRDYLHGADSPKTASEIRMQLLVYGVLDDGRHQELLNRSIEKFHGQAN